MLPGKLCGVPKERGAIWKRFGSHVDTLPTELFSMPPLFLSLQTFLLVNPLSDLLVLSNVSVALSHNSGSKGLKLKSLEWAHLWKCRL